MFSVLFSGAVLFACGAAAITTLGLLSVMWRREWTRRNSGWFAAFAAGALVSIALLHLLPEAFAATLNAPVYLLVGFAGAYFLNSGTLALDHHHHHHHHGHGHTHAHGQAAIRLNHTAFVPVIAIGFHSFVDGIAYAVTFSVDFMTGFLTVLGLIFHEVPEGIIVFTLLQRSGMENERAFKWAFVGSALTTPIGALLGVAFISYLSPDMLGVLFAVTAGVLMFIGTSHLLPHLEHEPLKRKVPALLLGGMVGVVASLAHSGEDHRHGAEDHPAPGAEQQDDAVSIGQD